MAPGARPAPTGDLQRVPTPTQTTCEEVAALLGVPLHATVKSVALMGASGFCLLLVRGDHHVNEIKAAKIDALGGDFRAAQEEEIIAHLGSKPGFIGPVSPKQPITVIADRDVASMADFICGANAEGFHLTGVNWGRDLPEPAFVADIRNVVAGDASPDGAGALELCRGIEVGHVFQLGQKYAEAMGATVLDESSQAQVMYMGCYGVGVSRIVAAAIEQNNDGAGIIWPEAIAPWQVAICIINPKSDPAVTEAAAALYAELQALGIDVLLDDRGLRPGPMFADIELIGIPHRVVVSERGLAAGTFEYRARTGADSEALAHAELLGRLRRPG